jgi:hypothetical protein
MYLCALGFDFFFLVFFSHLMSFRGNSRGGGRGGGGFRGGRGGGRGGFTQPQGPPDSVLGEECIHMGDIFIETKYFFIIVYKRNESNEILKIT